MDTIKILINDIKANISDEVISLNLKDRLYTGGVLTQGPISVMRDGGDLIITLGVFGTIDLAKIAACVTRYLKDPEKREIVFSSGSDVVWN